METLVKETTEVVTPAVMPATIDTGYKVFSTTDYSTVKRIEGNRGIDPSNVRNIMLSMSKKQLIVPAILNEKMENIDGQHRFEASKALNLPFYYIVVPGYRIEDVQRINTHMKNWNLQDYLDSYSMRYDDGEKKFESYKDLRNLISKYSLTVSMALMMANVTMKKQTMDDIFKHGNFKFKSLKTTERFAESMQVFQKYSPALYSKTALPIAFAKLYYHDMYDQGVMEKNLLTQHSMLDDATTHKITLIILTGIYNYRTLRRAKMHSTVLEDAWSEMVEEEKK